MNEILSSLEFSELLFIIGVIGTFVTLPLADFITVGFYDITDFFLSMICTVVISNALGGNYESKQTMLVIFIVVSLILAFLKIFMVIPFMKNAETSTSSSLKDLEGVQGVVITSITKDGVGEIMVSTGFSRFNKMAKIYEDETHAVNDIAVGEQILIIEIKENIAYVIPYNSYIKLPKKADSSQWNNEPKKKHKKGWLNK